MNMIGRILQFSFLTYFIVSVVNTCSHHRVIDYIRAFFTLIFSAFYMYFIHVIEHKYNDTMFGKMHTAYHHNPKYKHTWYANIIEFLNNSQLLIFILVNNLIKKITNVEIFSNYMLFMLSLYYIWSHFIEFHYLPSCVHAYHHMFDNEENINHSSDIKNYGPRQMDIIFNTYHSCDDDGTVWLKYLSLVCKLGVIYYATSLIYKIKK